MLTGAEHHPSIVLLYIAIFEKSFGVEYIGVFPHLGVVMHAPHVRYDEGPLWNKMTPDGGIRRS